MSATTLVLLAGAPLAAGWALLEWHRRHRLTAAVLATGAITLTALVSLTLTGGVLVCAASAMYHHARRAVR